MFGITFGHNTLRKYVIYFGTLFNDISLNRYDANGALIQTSKVPLNYGPRDKFLARLEGNPDLNRQVAIQLPRMTFEMTGLYYDATRKLPTLTKISIQDPNNPLGKAFQYVPVPYNIDFTLSIMVKNVMDGTYIVEQILPYFTPVWQSTLNLNPDLNGKYDVPITLDNITHQDTYEGSFTERRAIIWTLNFTMKGWLFGPTSSTLSGIIKNIDLNFNDGDFGTVTTPSEVINITPGQTANGDPISEPPKLYTYGISAPNTNFYITERLSSIANTNDFAYIKTANSSFITAYDVGGNLVVGSTVTGSISGLEATITSVDTNPPQSIPANNVVENSNWGFIVDLIENT